MGIYLEKTFSVEKQLSEIHDSKKTIVMVWAGVEPIGFYYLLESISKPEILRFYVDNSWHGKGVGDLLMKHCLETAITLGFKTLCLGVWEKNFRALAFYRKYSFTEVGSHIFTLGTDDQVDLIMSRAL